LLAPEAEQGLPRYVEDEATLELIVEILLAANEDEDPTPSLSQRQQVQNLDGTCLDRWPSAAYDHASW
jgi:hypothetical protein